MVDSYASSLQAVMKDLDKKYGRKTETKTETKAEEAKERAIQCAGYVSRNADHCH